MLLNPDLNVIFFFILESEKRKHPMLKRIRLWHFIVLPLIAISILLSLWFLIGHFILDVSTLAPLQAYIFYGIRATVSSLVMGSLVAWLALKYKKNYEAEIQKKTEELEKTRDYLYTIINDSAEAIIGIDLDGKVTSWNKAAAQIYGYSEQEILGKGFEKLIPDHLFMEKELEKISEEVAEKGYIRSHITERIRKDGQKIYVSITRTSLRDKEGNPIGSSAIVRDITRLKQMEAKLIESETLAVVGGMAASIAHEIKNPLAGIRGGIELIAESFSVKDPKAAMIHEIIQQIDRLDRTVKDLLIFAKPTLPAKSRWDINTIVEKVLNVLEEDPASQNIHFERILSDNLHLVKVDSQQMEQVFFNIGLNALQAMNYNGKLTVRTYEKFARIYITFTDNGKGIPQNQQDQIFKPFYTTKAKGTGLGLSIVKKIIDAHQGLIDLQSNRGNGTTFIISLPSFTS
jgi:PAS domain S-box-containing protein